MSTILIVEDEHALGSALSMAVRRLGHLPELAPSGAAALERLATSRVDAVVLDIGLPDISGVKVLERIRGGGSQVPVLVITARAMLDHAIATQKLGIADYLIKPLDLAHFEQAVSALVAKGAWVSEITDSAPVTLIGAAATMQDEPRHAVAKGRMREDLFYAFSALAIAMPPLRERTGDIPALSRLLLAMRGTSGERVEITAQALRALQAYDWPGNVRELRHALEHARAMSRGGVVFPGHLPPHIAEALRIHGSRMVSGELDAAVARWIDSSLDTTPENDWRYDTMLDHIETSMLRHLLTRFASRPTHLAQALAMNRATLRQKLRRMGLND
jgi:DNA-binding NtrC family response regulator